ncbi:polyprenyl synthetase family protein [Mycobacterium vicinigordonae]|uniref:Polyprenyl synthetase family protein n=1 Tax=Mycobacterium vicinigordonae TaxID=1719132 RepID=A0A7D6IUB5_9MYCO|nr:polyprenyl synthetase family protein [Mycobacterium vicinigordonae]QLL09039.1 polyprenyl synthetase family protein [Mycobacterium vicinigordonae]
MRTLQSANLDSSVHPAAGRVPIPEQFDSWRLSLRGAVLDEVAQFVSARCADEMGGCGVDVAGDVLLEFVRGGKCLRSTFMYLGWLAGARPNGAALSATASLELLHAFALLQDDVMDDSPSRRGQPAAHVQLAEWHRKQGMSGSARRFGESAATLLGDLCLIWAEQMLRNSGLERHHLQRAWPRYDAMRTELAVGQFADLTMDLRNLPTMQSVLGVARMKSGNYTVRRPLEIGAAMAGCDERALSRLGEYGTAVGEAFQLRDDILGVFGSPETTGKPNGGDLLERKATSVVVAAYEMANRATRQDFGELIDADDLDDAALDRWRSLILGTGAVQWIEELIDNRVEIAHKALDSSGVDTLIRSALTDMAGVCTRRAA